MAQGRRIRRNIIFLLETPLTSSMTTGCQEEEMLALFVNIEGAWLIILRTGRILPLLTFLYINNLSQGKYHIYDKMKTILRGRGLF